MISDIDVQQLLDKAEKSLGASEVLNNSGYHDFSAARSYYAMFYTSEAALLSIGQSFSKHSAVISAFGKEFVKSGKLPSKLHQSLTTAF